MSLSYSDSTIVLYCDLDNLLFHHLQGILSLIPLDGQSRGVLVEDRYLKRKWVNVHHIHASIQETEMTPPERRYWATL